MYNDIIKNHGVIIKTANYMDNYTNGHVLLTEVVLKSIIFECVHTL